MPCPYKHIMTYNPERHHRHSIRLKGYDYSQAGAYFVTICTYNKACILGNVVNGQMLLNDYGRAVEMEWTKTASIRDNVELDGFVVMPNHFHGIIIILSDCRGTARRALTLESFGKPVIGSLPTIVRSFKSAVTKQINKTLGTPNMPVWQRNYYEHVIRNEDKLNRIREYVLNNPLQWQFDRENPGCIQDEAYDSQWGDIEGMMYGKMEQR